MDAARAGRFWPADQAEVLENLARHQRYLANLRPRDARDGIQVDPELVRMVEVAGADRMGIEVDATEVDDPGQLGYIPDHDLLGGSARRKAQLDRFDPFRPRGRRPLLKERLAFRAVDKPLQRHRPSVDAANGALGNGHVVAHQVKLGMAGARKEDLVGIGNRHVPSGGLDDLLPRRSHADTLLARPGDDVLRRGRRPRSDRVDGDAARRRRRQHGARARSEEPAR